MSEFDQNTAIARGLALARAAVIDQGLRAHMVRVYNYMAGGVALTGIVAWLTYQAAGGDAIAVRGSTLTGLTPFGQALFDSPLMWLFVLAPLGLVFFLGARVGHMQARTVRTLFFAYAGLLGLSFASIFLAYTAVSITRVFFVSAAAFGALSLWGYTTERDLSGIGAFMVMGLFGLIIASLVNVFLKSSGLDWALSVAGVTIFAGLTAWDSQRIKDCFDPMDDGTVAVRKAVLGALALYLDFVNLFLLLLRLVGARR